LLIRVPNNSPQIQINMKLVSIDVANLFRNYALASESLGIFLAATGCEPDAETVSESGHSFGRNPRVKAIKDFLVLPLKTEHGRESCFFCITDPTGEITLQGVFIHQENVNRFTRVVRFLSCAHYTFTDNCTLHMKEA
jgi:hypothetical protein